MPQYLRTLKNIIRNTDLELMQKDLDLIKEFMSIEARIGRKPANWHADLKNVMIIRHGISADVKASFKIKDAERPSDPR